MLRKLKAYYYLTKPGIIYGNLLTCTAGFLVAAKWHFRLSLLIATLVGTSLVIAAACVYNNYLDREIDKKMARTKRRALVSGEISTAAALLYATALCAAGFAVLVSWVNGVVVTIGLIGFVDYVLLYGWAKRHSLYSTLVGSISGAMPVVAGYCAVTNRFDVGAWLLFLTLALWQMPHFYAIGLYRRQDYSAADLPIVPVQRPARVVQQRILLYILGFLLSLVLLSIQGVTGVVFGLGMGLLALEWLRRGLVSLRSLEAKAWGKQMFLFSLVVISGFSVLLAFGSVLP